MGEATFTNKEIDKFIENEKVLDFKFDRELVLSNDGTDGNQKIFYITDIHLMTRISNANCKSQNDIVYFVSHIANKILEEVLLGFHELSIIESKPLVLIGGDTSNDFAIFRLFVEKLRESNENLVDFIFVLGNHELWPFPYNDFESIVNTYRLFLEENGMYLLQNDIIYKDTDDKMYNIATEELLLLDEICIREKVRKSRIIFFGGIGFSGYNEEFNANKSIYRLSIDRETEVKETYKFEILYDTVYNDFFGKNLVVFTHMPKDCWHKIKEYEKDVFYVNGHTHRNFFYDDGEYHIYSDNQLGYHNENLHLKYFYMQNEYDYFGDYKDGIYEITDNQYFEFYRGKNIRISFNREINILYMLKKNGYYCFIHKSKRGSLTILNGGALKKLDENNVKYYYDNMEKVINHIKKPLNVFTKFQEQISYEIKRIGGSGKIHGCIIDIDFNSHIYVNPFDMTITGYWALNIIDKIVYPDIPTLLKEKCYWLYEQYKKLISENDKNLIIINENAVNEVTLLPKIYLNTDIYKVSRNIKKMQKLSSNILSTWNEQAENELVMDLNKFLIDIKNKQR